MNTNENIEQQKEMINGYPFNHQDLFKPKGLYIGESETKGAFIHNPFKETGRRKSFKRMVLGSPGDGEKF